MRTFSIIFAFLFFSACSVHTVTNKTAWDFKIKKSGGDQLTLKANSCLELSEYFIGLGGDFPFAIKIDGDPEYSGEHSAGNYEIKAVENTKNLSTTTGTRSFSVSLSSKNLSCEEEKADDESSGKINEEASAMCGETPAKCENSGKAKCNSENTPVCVDENNNLIEEKPSCEDKSLKIRCNNKEALSEKIWVKDDQTRVFCLSGEAKCSGTLEVACVKEKDGNHLAVPACLNGVEKVADVDCVDSVEVRALSDGGTPKCLQPITVTLPTSQKTVSCGGTSGAESVTWTAECNEGGNPVCGKIPGDSEDEPYCVNSDNIRWSLVTCSNGETPSCP